jgi:hypothetical protein
MASLQAVSKTCNWATVTPLAAKSTVDLVLLQTKKPLETAGLLACWLAGLLAC